MNTPQSTFKVTFLGTGTSLGVPIPGCKCEVCSSNDKRDKRLRTSCLITFENIVNKTALRPLQIAIDAGPDFRYQMLRADVQHLDAILITHEHRDHTAGLDDVRAYNYLQQKAMPLYGNKKALQGVEKMMYYAFHPMYPGVPEFELHFLDVNNDKYFTVGGIDIVPIEVMHAKLPVLAYRIGNFAYITDAKTISEKEKQKLNGVKTLVVNALREEEHFSHFTLQQALDLIEEIKPDVAYLTHMSHLMGPYETFQKRLPANVFLAYDGLQIHAQ
ncbi:MAG: MBL fold metallo-hydrolase [Bacteroidales bacterium]|nr:MBL fold metallo-hydrolase [Bacteroidales bacterium]